jgi:drug/metabolite transporter (DMT)-like permease
VPARRSLLVLAFVTVSVVWGSTYLGIRVALESYAPFYLGAVRFTFAGALLYGVARLRGEPAPDARRWGSSAVMGVLFFVIGNGLLNVAERSVSSGLASVLVATMPLWTAVFGRMFGARSSPREVVGVLLGLVGVVVLNLGGDLRASPFGAASALLAPLGWGLGSVLSQRLTLPGGLMRTATQMFTGGVAMLIVSLAARESFTVGSPRSMIAVVYLVIFGSLVGFTAFTYMLAHMRPAVATSYAYVNPVIAVALGLLLAGEHFGIASAVGAVIVLAAVALVQKGPSAAPVPVQPSQAGEGLAQAGPAR